MTDLAIVVLSYNAADFLKGVIFSLLAQFDFQVWQDIGAYQLVKKMVSVQHPKSKITLVIVDNNSHDNSLAIASEAQRRAKEIDGIDIKIIANKKNLGFAEGNNVGVNWALKQGIINIGLLNNDTLVGNAFWDPLVDFLADNPQAGVVTTKIYFAPGYEYQHDYQARDKGKVFWAAGGVIDWQNVIGANRGVDEVDRGQYNDVAQVAMASGCLFLARAQVWKTSGLLDKKYFMYYEDADWAQRVQKHGWKIYYVPGGKIWHFNAGSSSVGGDLQDYFITRNRLLFGMRWAPWRARLALLRESGRLLYKGRHWQRIGARDFYLRRFGKGSWRK